MKYKLYLDDDRVLWVLNVHDTIHELDEATVEHYHLDDFPKYDIELDFYKYINIYMPSVKALFAEEIVRRLHKACLHNFRPLHYARQLVAFDHAVQF